MKGGVRMQQCSHYVCKDKPAYVAWPFKIVPFWFCLKGDIIGLSWTGVYLFVFHRWMINITERLAAIWQIL